MEINPEEWMTNLPPHLRAIPIINLAIPGSHDSMTYGIKTKAPVAPDANDSVHRLNRYVPCVVKRWAITQYLSAYHQLTKGVRYLDLRFSLKLENSKLYFVHGLYSEEILGPLNEINQFLNEHPQETVILDCQHFYNFSAKIHNKLSSILIDIFGYKIFGKIDGHLSTCSLNEMANKQKQLIIIYRNNLLNMEKFWQSWYWVTPWPNTIKISQLEEFLQQSLTKRPYGSGYVTQCVLTPTSKFIIPRFYSSLRKACAKPVFQNLTKWIEQQTPGPYSRHENPTVNVFLADFIDIKNSNFCYLIITLNYKIAPETQNILK